MVQRPPDSHPENFILGKGSYTGRRAATPHADESQFRFDPAPIPPIRWSLMIGLNTLYVLFFAGFIWILRTHRDPDVNLSAANVLISAICLMTCGGTVGLLMFERWLAVRDKRQGPWLVYEKSTRRVSLPRLHLNFDRTEVDHLQYVSTDSLQNPRSAVSPPRPVSELNLVTLR